jgi:hypothetical protein
MKATVTPFEESQSLLGRDPLEGLADGMPFRCVDLPDHSMAITVWGEDQGEADERAKAIADALNAAEANASLLASVRELHATLLDGMEGDYDEMVAQLGRARLAIAKAEK